MCIWHFCAAICTYTIHMCNMYYLQYVFDISAQQYVLFTICVFSISVHQYVLIQYLFVICTIYNVYLTFLCINMYLYNMCIWHWPFQRRSPSKTENASCRVGQNAPHVKKDEVATKCHMGPILRKQFAQCNLFCLACETEDIINATSDQW